MIEHKIGLKTKQWMKKELMKVCSESENLFIINLSKMSVTEQEEVRNKLRKEQSSLLMVKNSVCRKAFKELDLKNMHDFLKGATGIVLTQDNFIKVNKILFDFTDQMPNLKVKGGLIENEVYGFVKLEELSKLPSKEVLVAQFVGNLAAPLAGFVNVLDNQIKKILYVVQQIKKSKE